ncbi:MAG: hypothetical protein A2Y03_02670 [Omnitrophica WOR_2 bacterium GWF2_38_59]|nr:MAG: hypothetical protein A2Y03_02670 [Omnitrophica WOR_2 bacterium GWF2_38_59]OGX47212.1 MAG: hypothetical protein A2243_06980 [Omnitrophica WOR_2 bacterium RIFOXYA2_FULL_38_17]OGX50673.1 MAG: hypothetical protein A2267_06345 [Omnitrophica WOR_2 bacterium RIFOXYA12_FULL_38_10]OGX59341.1 MAG: hypothetical protein A2306_01315 [Omnitrophica WOR_2 bacterium RIFOXYB2_FULL_38_16]HBG62344.1 hypothetical protein [Candidatus Omnitrophota bacterium]
MGFLEKLRKKIDPTYKKEGVHLENCEVNNLIALGVLLWAVAEADEKFLPEEKGKIVEVIKACENISDEDMPIVLRAIEEASINKIDYYEFTSEVKKGINKESRIAIIENLFRVGCIDGELDNDEIEIIRKISGLFMLEHQEFVDAKIKVKKEFGMDVAGL